MPAARSRSGKTSTGGSDLEPIGDPDEETPDFAGEHEQFVVAEDDDTDGGESESPDRYAGGLDGEGPP